MTEYSDSTDETQNNFTGQSLLRTYATAGLSLVGPSFSRIYDVDIGPWDKIKHVIEPRIDYTYVSNVEDPEKIPAFDTIDTTLGENQVRYAIVNRLLARTAGGAAGSAQEIASLRDRADVQLHAPADDLSDPGHRAGSPAGRSRGSSGSRGAASSMRTPRSTTTRINPRSRPRPSRGAPTGARTTST